jgi:hypothetical protein
MYCLINLQKVYAILYFWSGVGRDIVVCHVISRQGKPVDLTVSVRVAMKQWTWLWNLRIAPRRSNDLWYVFLWAEGILGGQIHQRMCAQYGDNDVSCRVVYEWIEMAKNGCMSVTGAEHSDCPTTQNEERAREWFFKTEELTVDENCKKTISALGLPILWCTITFSSIKCVPGGYLRNWRVSITA